MSADAQTSRPGRAKSTRALSAGRVSRLWLLLRCVLSGWALLCSAMWPRTLLELSTRLWPPSGGSFGEWLRRLWLAPWLRWDAEYYLKIAERGYRTDDGTAQFHPLYPWLGRAVGQLMGGQMLLGLLLVSSACALLLFLSLERLARLDLPPETSRRAVFYFAHAPVAFVFFAPYTESLFLLCAVWVFLSARRGEWWRAGLVGGLAALTRQQGIFLLVPLAWEFWEWAGRSWRGMIGAWRSALGLALVPAGLLLWLVYRAAVLGDVAFDWHAPRTLIYGLLISRSGTVVVPTQGFTWPWHALRTALNYPNSTNVIDLTLAGVFVILLLAGGRLLWRIRPSYLLYSAVIIIVSFSFTTGEPWAYMGLPRHCLLAFPLFFPLAVWGRRPLVHQLSTLLGMIFLLLLTMLYVAKSHWVT